MCTKITGRCLLTASAVLFFLVSKTQDRIFFKNGLLTETVVAGSSPAEVYTGSEKPDTIPASDIYMIHYKLGGYKFFTGKMARRNRDRSHVYYPTDSKLLLFVGFEPLMGYNVLAGLEYFPTKYKTKSIRISGALGVDPHNQSFLAGAPIMRAPRNRFGLDYFKYTSLERQCRFFIGPGIRLGSFYELKGHPRGESPLLHDREYITAYAAVVLTAGLNFHICPDLSAALTTAPGVQFCSGPTEFHSETALTFKYNLSSITGK